MLAGRATLRILCVGNRYPPWSTGGYETVWASSVQALRTSGHPTRVLTTLPDPSDHQWSGQPPPDTHRELRWYWRAHRFPRLSLAETVRLERDNARVLERHLRDHAPGLVIWWSMGGMSMALLEQVRRHGIPALGLVADDWMLYGPRVDGWARRWRRVPRMLSGMAERVWDIPARVDLGSAARWLFISRYLLDGARGQGVRPPSAGILSPGVDPGRFAPRPPGRWDWRLLYCGRLDPRKGVATAIEALAELPTQARLTIDGTGSPEHTGELRALSQRLGVAARVCFANSPPDRLPEVYATADAVLFPVRWQEPWGLVPLEAMSVGRPVVASRAGGGVAEYLREGENCLQFTPGDAGELAGAVRRLAGAQSLRAALVAGGSNTAGRYTEQAFHAGLLAEVSALAGG